MKLEFSRQIFEKSSNNKCSESPSSGSRELFHADGRTDRHDEANSRFSQFCEKRLKTAKITLKFPELARFSNKLIKIIIKDRYDFDIQLFYSEHFPFSAMLHWARTHHCWETFIYFYKAIRSFHKSKKHSPLLCHVSSKSRISRALCRSAEQTVTIILRSQLSSWIIFRQNDNTNIYSIFLFSAFWLAFWLICFPVQWVQGDVTRVWREGKLLYSPSSRIREINLT